MYLHDTIVAPATAPGHSAVAIIRLSGPLAITIARQLWHPASPRLTPLEPRRLHLGILRDPATGAALDQGLLAVMPAPHSFTAEDVAELHCHGGPYIVRRIVALAAAAGARIAAPGEFTRRAFLNGRLDLTAAEAIADLVNATSEGALHKALAQLSGALADRVHGLRRQIIELRAHLEVAIDFADEDVPAFTPAAIADAIERLAGDITVLHDSFRSGRIIREGVRATVIGKPNAGKSSLLNLLLGSDRAIVTSIPGTTRDVIEETVRLGPWSLVLEDTAGLRASSNEAERIGISRARAHAASADLILAVFDSSRRFDSGDADLVAFCHDLADVNSGSGTAAVSSTIGHSAQARRGLALLNKSDLPPRLDSAELRARGFTWPTISISALTGAGLPDLRKILENEIEALSGGAGEDSVVISRERHRDALAHALECLAAARTAALSAMPPEIVVVDITAAGDALGLITGEVGSEDVLDAIFREFCLGK
ncbi:MAG: tRNA uridine-5-carboxymethylaminomethyl(34) synthesis GTPase MnmE [Candidatus Binataceae bacterium]|jgi:tRNA modification GTPase